MKPEHRLIGIIGAMDSELETLLAAAGFADIAVYRREKEELCIVARKQARNDQNGGRR